MVDSIVVKLITVGVKVEVPQNAMYGTIVIVYVKLDNTVLKR